MIPVKITCYSFPRGTVGAVNNEFEYLGRKEQLCGRQAIDQMQEIKDKPGGGSCDQLYQRMNCILLQYKPKIVSSVSRAVMYIDPETYACYWVEFFDKRGRPYLFYAVEDRRPRVYPWMNELFLASAIAEVRSAPQEP